jgi:hypothetical protein
MQISGYKQMNLVIFNLLDILIHNYIKEGIW